eukprot:TRINITY_DN4835_c0_g1_i2.p1 TRINITY_DN4835_c0_g1~~TRINITY_DN4835_c0_g1_i2.p1  ORF type:complete len:413 (+),score=114.53 TRINITY_DN4835_c0_g1_i2:51-1289(+)
MPSLSSSTAVVAAAVSASFCGWHACRSPLGGLEEVLLGVTEKEVVSASVSASSAGGLLVPPAALGEEAEESAQHDLAAFASLDATAAAAAAAAVADIADLEGVAPVLAARAPEAKRADCSWMPVAGFVLLDMLAILCVYIWRQPVDVVKKAPDDSSAVDRLKPVLGAPMNRPVGDIGDSPVSGVGAEDEEHLFPGNLFNQSFHPPCPEHSGDSDFDINSKVLEQIEAAVVQHCLDLEAEGAVQGFEEEGDFESVLQTLECKVGPIGSQFPLDSPEQPPALETTSPGPQPPTPLQSPAKDAPAESEAQTTPLKVADASVETPELLRYLPSPFRNGRRRGAMPVSAVLVSAAEAAARSCQAKDMRTQSDAVHSGVGVTPPRTKTAQSGWQEMMMLEQKTMGKHGVEEEGGLPWQ